MKCKQCTREITRDELAASGYKRKDGSYGKLNICKDCNSINAGFYKYLRQGKSVDEYLEIYKLIVDNVYNGELKFAHLPTKVIDILRPHYDCTDELVNGITQKPKGSIDRFRERFANANTATDTQVKTVCTTCYEDVAERWRLTVGHNLDIKVFVKRLYDGVNNASDLIDLIARTAKEYGIKDMLDKDGVLKGFVPNNVDSNLIQYLVDKSVELEDVILYDTADEFEIFDKNFKIDNKEIWESSDAHTTLIYFGEALLKGNGK